MARGPEAVVKDAVKKVLKARGIWYSMAVPGGYGKNGLPDFICCCRGMFLAIETKAPGKRGNTTANQDRVIREIIGAEGAALVIDDVAQLEEFLENRKW